MTEPIEQRWRELLERGMAETREVDATSPLRMLVGVASTGRPYFAIITDRRPGLPTLTSAIEVSRRQRQVDDRWSLTLELQVPSLTDAFISLVSELAVKSASKPTEASALEVFLETLAEWQELLTSRVDRLSEAALRGLVAELWFGFESDAHGHAIGDVVRAWSGPLGAPRDYTFLSPTPSFEVKALRPNRTRVEISSEEQLDGESIRLAVVTLEQVQSDSVTVTLPSLIRGTRGRLTDGAERGDFNRRFAELHVDPDDEWYADQLFVVRRLQIFGIDNRFPAIRASELPNAITRVRYHIDTADLGEWLLRDEDYTKGGTEDG